MRMSSAPAAVAITPNQKSISVLPPVNGNVVVPAAATVVGVVLGATVEPSVCTDVEVVLGKIVVDVLPSTPIDVVVVGSVVVVVGSSDVVEPSTAIDVVVVGASVVVVVGASVVVVVGASVVVVVGASVVVVVGCSVVVVVVGAAVVVVVACATVVDVVVGAAVVDVVDDEVSPAQTCVTLNVAPLGPFVTCAVALKIVSVRGTCTDANFGFDNTVPDTVPAVANVAERDTNASPSAAGSTKIQPGP